MEDFSLNTHHAYLNTDVVIRNNMTTPITVKDTTTSDQWFVDKKKLIHLSAGTHHLVSGKTKTTITIEDAVKFGGSNVKKAFVFDDNPWVFITTRDRLYATNTETNEEKVEHNITPNSIESLGKNCEYFLFNTKKDFSIYNVKTGEIVKKFSDHIYSNNYLVIYRIEERVVVYDYRLDKIITDFDGKYSLGKKFYFVKERKLYGLDLSSSYINNINIVGEINKDYFLYDNYLVKLESDYLNSKTYYLYSLENGENNIKRTSCVFPYYIESWKGHSSDKLTTLKKELDEYKNIGTFNDKFPNVMHHIFVIKISDAIIKEENKNDVFKLIGEIVSYPSIRFNVSFTMTGIEETSLHFRDAIIVNKETKALTEKSKESDSNILQLPQEEKLIGQSSSGNLVISIISDNRIIYRNIKDGTKTHLFNELFDTSHYVNAYFTSDGKNAVFVNQNEELCIFGFENLLLDKFDVEGITVSRQVGVNGYKPDIVFVDARIPVWRDPISLFKINQEELSKHIFMSSDGTFYAENNYRVIFRNRITNKNITNEEYYTLCTKYNFTWDDSDEDKKVKITHRKKLLEEVGKYRLFSYVIEKYYTILSGSGISEIEKQIRNEIENYINEKDCFTPLFLDEFGYVIYRNNRTHEENKILIGRSVYYLNYVSFSYDSRYLAFGAKMRRDDFRMSENGVFVLYDLQKEKEIIRQDQGSNLYAVWMTMFSKDGNVAYYDSRADAYIATKESDYKCIQKIAGKSLLCFSPSGKYIAFSDQNYMDYTHHPNLNWGHQPSGNIYIHAVKDVQTCLEQYNDFGNGIAGVMDHAGNVASAAFSCDEKRLMAVGDDGVVVVRNLHIHND